MSEFDELLRDKQSPEKKYKEEGPKRKEISVLKHSRDGLLAEAVIVGNKPYFAVSRINGGKEPQITLEESIENETTKFMPLSESMSKPFVFNSMEEFDNYMEKSKNETLDSLCRKVKSIWKKYIDADDFHISICAADTIFTYYQDKIGLTHYLFFVGGNDTGKSNNLTVIEYLGYRVFNSIGITAANIYTALGNGEEGQCTICEDEADNIDYDHEKKKIYKCGYTAGKKIARTDLPQGIRSQNKWNTYCSKFFAAERLPDAVKAKGFNQRIVELLCRDGFPQYDIAEVTTPGGEEEFENLLDELNEVHNVLLAYKLLHFHEKIPNIQLNIANREKQLFKPILRIFQNTETLKELLPVVSKYINQRRENNTNSLEACVYRIVDELIGKRNSPELETSTIWEELKHSLPGADISGKPLSYDSAEFGIISQTKITRILEQQFGAKKPKHKGSSTKLIFSNDRLKGLARKYANVEVKVSLGELGELGEVSGSMGLDRHMSTSNYDNEISEKEHENDDIYSNICSNNGQKNAVLIGGNDSKTPAHPYKPPQTSPSSPNFDTGEIERIGSTMGIIDRHRIEEINLRHIKRIGKTAKFECDSCKIVDDIHFMRLHLCNGMDYEKEGV